jgi:hypothetical protein
MPGRSAHRAVILALLGAVGCGSPERATMPAACSADAATIVRALERAPAAVTLGDGTRLSRCVRLAAVRDGDLQTIGVTLTQAADRLRADAASDPVAALRLGYLVGGVRRGAAQTPGVAAQLARRLERLASFGLPADGARQLQEGIRLGEAGG